MKPVVLVNVAELGPGEPFVDLPELDGAPVEWISHSGEARNAIERRVRRPRLSRYRAAFGAARDARKATAMISHLPRMTAAVESFVPLFGRRPHLAFSFNFTALPTGADLARMKRAFAPVEQFCVYSKFEAELYADVFGLPRNRFRPVLWTQEPPPVDESLAVPERPFAVAIGGEGRDYAGIIAAARAAPDVQWVLVARPSALLENAPANVQVHCNLPLAQTWGIANRAAVSVVPLLSDETCCGQITLVGTQMLGIPMVTTRSKATQEYLEGSPATTVVEPGDPDALAEAIARAVNEAEARRVAAQAARAGIAARYDRRLWADYVADFIRRSSGA